MASELAFKKEFEDVIIKQNFKEALNSLMPNSKEYIYLQFCEEYKKCINNRVISEELNTIIKNSESISHSLSEEFKLKKNLLEYDLDSTNQERKNDIIDKLYKKYCKESFDYKPPYFVKEKSEKKNEMEIEDNDNDDKIVLELTEDIIKQRVEQEKQSELEYAHSDVYFYEISYAKRIELFFIYIEKEKEEKVVKIINRRGVPFFLMTKDEFSKVIQFLNSCKKIISEFANMTLEQIERLLNEVNNPEYISKEKLISRFINKKYGKLLDYAKDNLNELKNLLIEIYNFLVKYSSKYCSEVLIKILKINQLKDIIDIKPLIEYLKIKKEPTKEEKAEKYNYDKHSLDLSIDDASSKIEEFIEEQIFNSFFHEKAKIKNFIEYIDKNTLERLYYISRLLRGEEPLSPINDKYITYSQYCDLAKKKEITICEHNSKEFKVNEDIKIDLDIKNIRSINISIYEINTENYYLEKKEEINGSLDIDGLIASKNYDIKIEGTENPLKRIRKTIEFNQIPKDKPGVYLIDLLGDGISSRIIIKKGKLNLISRNTSEGIMCQIINEKNELLKDSKTFLWYRNTKFSCEPNEGLFVLPYKILSYKFSTCVLVHDSFADIAQISIPTENFKLEGYFQFLNESLIFGQAIKVTFHPFLFDNDNECSLENIKNGKITIKIEKEDNEENLPIKKLLKISNLMMIKGISNSKYLFLKICQV